VRVAESARDERNGARLGERGRFGGPERPEVHYHCPAVRPAGRTEVRLLPARPALRPDSRRPREDLLERAHEPVHLVCRTAVPMTFVREGRQFIVVASGAVDCTKLIALTLP
jgi:hypothetical protein